MTPRERVRCSINHEAPDRVPLDLGSTSVTGIHVIAYRALERLLGIDGGPVRVIDPFQMLAEVRDPVREALGIDTVGVQLPTTVFGFRNENWKPWRLFDGTEVQVAGGFVYRRGARGDILLYPQGDRRAQPSGRMAKDGYYFDALVRQPPIEEKRLDPRKWVEQSFSLYTDEDARYLEETFRRAFEETEYAVVGNFCDGGLGDIGIVPGPNVKDPVGIRDPEEWYISLITRKDYIGEIFELQTDMALKNLETYRQACGDRIDVIDVSEADYGGQRGLLFSRDVFGELFRPRLERINGWIHAHTGWKIFYHSCGAISEILGDLVEIGVDIINPVQYTAHCMDLADLKKNFGDRLVFWGGGVETQHVLPFGTPEEVWNEVVRTIETLSAGGGFVFSAVHNIQANIPKDNMAALFGAFKTHECTDDAKT